MRTIGRSFKYNEGLGWNAMPKGPKGDKRPPTCLNLTNVPNRCRGRLQAPCASVTGAIPPTIRAQERFWCGQIWKVTRTKD